MEDDVAGQQQEISRTRLDVCDLCGRPMPEPALQTVPIARGGGEPVEAARVCSSCGRRLETDEMPADASVDDTLSDDDF